MRIEFLVAVEVHTCGVYNLDFFSDSKILRSDSFGCKFQKFGISRVLEGFAAKDLGNFFFN